METRYAVITKFFDDGKIKVVGPLAFDGGEYSNKYEDRGNWDEYTDIFDSYEEAAEFIGETKNV